MNMLERKHSDARRSVGINDDVPGDMFDLHFRDCIHTPSVVTVDRWQMAKLAELIEIKLAEYGGDV